jgi:hypothetical protein
VRIPEWAEEIGLRINGRETSVEQVGGYLRTKPLRPGTVVQIDYHAHPYLETRRFERVKLPAALPARLDQVVVRFGPNVMVSPTSGRITDLALSTKHGVLELPAGQSKLTSWADLGNSANPHAFVFNVSLTP